MIARYVKVFVTAFSASFPSILGGRVLRSAIWQFFFKKSSGFVFDSCLISGFRNIELGPSCVFMSGLKLYADTGNVKIGSRCSVNHNVIIDGSNGGSIEIGDDVLIGPNVVLRSSNHIYSDLHEPIRNQGHQGGNIRIGNNVWIGSNVCILSAANIKDGCIIAAGAIVSGTCKPNAIYGGVPAKLLKYR